MRWRRRNTPTDFWLHGYRPQPGHVVLDVGAGLGDDTLLFSRLVGPAGRVFAIEANPKTYARMAARVARRANVVAIHAAIIDRIGRVWIEDRVRHEENTVSVVPGPGFLTESVPATTLEAVCEHHGIRQIDFLKMNIEGSERLALAGLGAIIECVDIACIACHDFLAEEGGAGSMRTRALVESFLVDHGFHTHRRLDDQRAYVRDHVWAGRKELDGGAPTADQGWSRYLVPDTHVG